MKLGRYELISKLGSGDMADVYKAKRTGPGGFEQIVALKQILAAKSSDPVYQAMLHSEARVQSQLHHPNLVQVLDYEEIDGSPVLALEHIHGASLHRLLTLLQQRKELLPWQVAVHIVTLNGEKELLAFDSK